MLPLTLLVATNVPIVVSMSAAPPAEPIPVSAVNVTVPVVTRLAVSAAVLSVIAPLPSARPKSLSSAETTMSPTVLTCERAMLPVASTSMLPVVD